MEGRPTLAYNGSTISYMKLKSTHRSRSRRKCFSGISSSSVRKVIFSCLPPSRFSIHFTPVFSFIVPYSRRKIEISEFVNSTETRHPGIFTMCFCQIVPIIHFHSPAFPLCVYKVRLHDENRKPAMACSTFAAFARGRCRASGYRLAADRAGEKYANVINRYHNVTS